MTGVQTCALPIYVTDIESALAHVHQPNTPTFPFAPWNRQAFRDQFVTQRVKTSILHSSKKKSDISTSISQVPEASNPTRLRRMLSPKTTAVPEALIEAEWNLCKPTRHYIPITLNAVNQSYYLEVLTNITTWYKHATTKEIHRNAMSKLWELRHVCEGGEKLQIIRELVKDWVATDQKFVLVAPTKTLYKAIKDMVEEFGINFIAIDEHVSPERREEITMQFADPAILGLISRTKLVCTGLNTLVYATKLVIAGLEYHPSTIRQMEKRLVRPGQLSPRVDVYYPVVRMSPRKSIEEEMLHLLLRKELAVNEVTKGKVRFMKPAMLIEAAMERQGAVKVLQNLVEAPKEVFQEIDLAKLFADSKAAQSEMLQGLTPEKIQIIKVTPEILEKMGFVPKPMKVHV